ncbi:MAG: M20/M25/M40 family metallo-hydrolase [Candidatus Cloacimonetes bacterium]|nr:M20/M25/M40 family metallo-hydrolase [Candidatus Cloacimonadota bacterium]
MKKLLLSLAVSTALITPHFAQDDFKPLEGKRYITVDSDASKQIKKQFGKDAAIIDDSYGVSLIHIEANKITELSEFMHRNFRRCGGFIVHEEIEEGIQTLRTNGQKRWANAHQFMDYQIDQEDIVKPMIQEVEQENIANTIVDLSKFHNRYYKSQSGVDAAYSIRDSWVELGKNREDFKVEVVKHSGFPQPSIIATLEGSEHSDEIVIIGGHLDSINGQWGAAKRRAPGADDNASGIATISEIIRVAMKHNYKPKRTIKFMGYAAEEVGLVGSKHIANDYKRNNKKVVGVIQLDMTNYQGDETDILFMDDYTNKAQNEFLGSLIDQYIGVSWGYSRCGYGCSDHASWHRAGYPASMPHEATMDGGNPHIHSTRDTISQSGSHAKHAAKFAKLGLAFMAELGK